MNEIGFKISSRLLDHIGLAMYSSLPKAISELVANSYDADSENIYITISETLPKGEIVIKDDGVGMNRKDIQDVYMDLGGMTRVEERTPIHDRLKIGSKGIGKLAGLGISSIMHIETVKNGKKCVFEIDRGLMEEENITLEKIKFPITEEVTKEKNGTKIVLKNLLSHVSSIKEEYLRRFLAQEFVSREKFHVFVNGEEIQIEEIEGVDRRKIHTSIGEFGEIEGYIIIAKKPRVLKKHHLKYGIVTTVRKRRVMAPTVFDINARGHHYRVAERIYGEIEVPFLDPEKPENKLDQFIISTSRTGFNLNHPKFIKYKEWVEKKLIEICRRLEAEQAEERKRKILQSDEFQKMLVKLPLELRSDVRDKVKGMIESIAPYLNECSPQRADMIVKALLKIIESGEMITILEKIEQAGEKDIKQLAKHLTSWGLYEINTVIGHVKTRLTIISKFEKLLEQIDTLEYPTIHKLFEKNLWLLDDDYRIFSSNKQLKTVLENRIMKKFVNHEKDRPDLIVKSSRDDVIIIELKRPSHLIDQKDFVQLATYKSIVKSHLPSTKTIKSYLIGNEYDEAVRDPEHGKIGIFMYSYLDILQQAKERYKELLSKLDR